MNGATCFECYCWLVPFEGSTNLTRRSSVFTSELAEHSHGQQPFSPRDYSSLSSAPILRSILKVHRRTRWDLLIPRHLLKPLSQEGMFYLQKHP